MLRTVVKICGLTQLEDAACAAEAGADMLGFIFYPPSPRAIGMAEAQMLIAELRRRFDPLPTLVGVFVNESPQHMLNVLNTVGLDLAQLSGKEPPATLAAMRGKAYKVLRGNQWQAEHDLWQTHLDNQKSHLHQHPDLLLEADHDTLYGGTGHRANEALATVLAIKYRLLLAGGLTPDNVMSIVRQIRPWGVDVASGTELSQGKKDHVKIRQFIDAVRNA